MAADDLAIGARIRARRLVRRITQFALADALGITFEQLREYETGRSPISACQLQQIATLLGAPVAAFTGPGRKGARPRRTSFSLLDSADAMRLMRAYTALPTSRMRRALVAVAEKMAGVGEPQARTRTAATRLAHRTLLDSIKAEVHHSSKRSESPAPSTLAKPSGQELFD